MKVGETMNNNKFEHQFKSELSKKVPNVLEEIKSNQRFSIPEKPKHTSILSIFNSKGFRYSFASTIMIVILAVMMLSGNTETQVYASTITLEINPQIQITLDENDNVIEVTAINDDGDNIVNHDIEYKGLTIDELIEYLINKFDDQGILISNEDNVILIHVDGVSTEVQERVLLKVERKIEVEALRHNKIMKFVKTNEYNLTEKQVKELTSLAREFKVSPQRLILMQQIRSLDETHTLRELAKLNMRELYRLEKSLSESPNGNPGGNRNPRDNN